MHPRRRCLEAIVSYTVAAAISITVAGCGTVETLSTSDETATAEVVSTASATSRDAVDTKVAAAASTPLPSPTPGFASLPTASSNAETMVLSGNLWVDARPGSGDVIAYVGEQECGRGQTLRLGDDPMPFLFIRILSNSDRTGCGVPGARVTVALNGRLMNDTVEWRPGQQQPVDLVAGPPFARISGELRFDDTPESYEILPYIDDVLCGQQLPTAPPRQGQALRWEVVVDPKDLKAGCGRAGAVVELRVSVAGQRTMVLYAIPWNTGTAVAPMKTLPRLDATSRRHTRDTRRSVVIP